MSAEYQPNLSFVSQIPAEFLKLREYSANPDISWIFLSASRNLKTNSAEGSDSSRPVLTQFDEVPVVVVQTVSSHPRRVSATIIDGHAQSAAVQLHQQEVRRRAFVVRQQRVRHLK